MTVTGYYNLYMLGLTPLQRLDAITRYDGGSANTPWFTAIGIIIVAVLIGLLLISICRRRKPFKKKSVRQFDDYAEAKDLTDREYRLLMSMAVNAELVRSEFIFSLPSVFDREAARLIEDTRLEQGMDQGHHLEAELAILREKIGFNRVTSPESNPANDTKVQSTRQIPPKRKFYIKRTRSSHGDLEATVIKNTPVGLICQFSTPIEIAFGQTWICRYYSGPYVAEFHTTVSKCSGQIVLLNHSNHVRLINRRRFLRVPVQFPAYVAAFPFKKDLSSPESLPRKKSVGNPRPESHGNQEFDLPKFIPAVVTELGGPGLRISTSLKLNVGDRVLILFKLSTKTHAEKVMEHIAKVRHIRSEQDSISAALELTGLDESGIDELIQATNEVSFEANKWKHQVPNTGTRSIWKEELQSV